MNTDSQALWDRRYEEGLPSLTRPDPYFVSAYERFVEPSFPNAGSTLDMAAGLGRHALWLAEKSWQVTAVDVSGVAIGKLADAARALDVNVDLFAVDAAEYHFRPAQFDLIVLFYHFDRSLFPGIVSALKPGGLYICKMAIHWGLEDDTTEIDSKPLGRKELASLVPALEIIEHHERPIRDRGVAELTGRKVRSSYPDQAILAGLAFAS
jgi:SAM-dependent methyltransferase